MKLRSLLTVATVASNCPITTLASPAQVLEPRATGVCGAGIYGQLASILAGYPVAQAFCTAVYPVKCPTSAQPAAAAITTTKVALAAQASAFSRIRAQGVGVVSTLCSCIEAPPKTCSMRTTATTTTSSTTTLSTFTSTTTSAAPPVHTVAAPLCNSNALDNGGCSDNCVCQTDAVSGIEYCVSQFSYEDPSIQCATDDDCPQGDFCESLDTANRCATGTQPGNECTTTYSPSRLFRIV